MPYCPKCESEYAEGIQECIECRVPLRPGRRPPPAGPDLEDVLLPLGLLACLVIASGLLALWFLARTGRLPEPLAGLILATQPSCLIPLYAIGVIFSTVLLAYWLVRRLLRRD